VMAMPVWSAFVIAIDLLVIYGLSAGWSTAEAHHKRASQEDEGVYRSGHRAAHTAPRQASSPEQSGERRQTTGWIGQAGTDRERSRPGPPRTTAPTVVAGQGRGLSGSHWAEPD